MKIIQDRDKNAIEERLKEVEEPVTIINFTQEIECQFCKEARWLLEDLTSLSDKLSLEVYNFQLDKEMVEKYRIDKIPALRSPWKERSWNPILWHPKRI